MDAVKRLVSTNSLKTTLLSKLPQGKRTPPLFFNYDKEIDTFMLLVVSPEQETVVHYVDEYVALLYIPETYEVVGLQIEDFQSQFIPKYNSLEEAWKLSNTKVKRGNVWDLTLAIEEKKLTVALEVIKATEAIVGRPAKALERALSYA